MKKMLPVEELARDERFVRVALEDRFHDRRQIRRDDHDNRLTPDKPDVPDRARELTHGIFVGEIQALEGAGRTCWDFDDVPFQLKLDMARQCWDEARHCEISVKLGEWMGTEIGEFSEGTFLYEAACNPDPVLRLTGVNRALERLAIDVFNTMRLFGRKRSCRSRSGWRGTRTASGVASVPACRSSAPAAGTTSGRGTGSRTRRTPCSTGCGPPARSRGATSTPRVPRRRPRGPPPGRRDRFARDLRDSPLGARPVRRDARSVTLHDTSTGSLGHVRARREDLRQRMIAFEQALAAPSGGDPSAWWKGLLAAAGQLKEAFDRHVADTEAPDGFLDEVVQHAPHLARRRAALLEDHAAIAAELGSFIDVPFVADASGVDAVRDLGLRVLGALVRHRHKGAELIYDAYNVDIGVSD